MWVYTVTHKRKISIQVGCSTVDRKEQGIQCSNSKGSYGRIEKEGRFLTYDNFKDMYLWNKDYTISWLKEEGLIASKCTCDVCQSDMKWVESSDRSDGYV